MIPALQTRKDLPPLMTLMFLLVDLLEHLRHLLDRQIRLDFQQDGLQLSAGEGERVRTGNASRERSRPRSPFLEPQLTPIPMSDSDDDQPSQDGTQWQRSISRDRVHPHVQAPQEPRVQPMVIQEPATVPDEDPTVVNPSLLSAGPSPSAEQRGRYR